MSTELYKSKMQLVELTQHKDSEISQNNATIKSYPEKIGCYEYNGGGKKKEVATDARKDKRQAIQIGWTNRLGSDERATTTKICSVSETEKDKIDEDIEQMKKLIRSMSAQIAQVEEMRAEKVVKVKSEWKSIIESASKAMIPHNFVMPDLEKYAGNSDPSLFMFMYLHAFLPYQLGEATVLNIFPRYLSRGALKWYYHKNNKVWEYQTIDELRNAFIERFNINSIVEVEVQRELKKKLRNLKQGPSEKFLSFMIRWKELASEVDDIPDKEHQIAMVLESLNSTYSDFMAISVFTEFKQLMIAGSNLDDALAKDEVAASNNINQEQWSRFQNLPRPMNNSNNYHPENRDGNFSGNMSRNTPSIRHFDELGMPLSRVLTLLKSKKVIESLPQRRDSLPMGSKLNEFCEYHQAWGHHTNYCFSLKNKVQDLIDGEVIPKPNVRRN